MNTTKIGILWGIWPEASAYIYSELIWKLKESNSITSNSDYPQIKINNINAPELTGDEITDDMLEPYISWIKELSSLSPDFILMVCNTIHLFYDKISIISWVKNIVSLTDLVRQKLWSFKWSICILWTPSTVTWWLYNFSEHQYINPTHQDLLKIGTIVNRYNAYWNIQECRSQMTEIMKTYKQQWADIFLTACTEISNLLEHTSEYTIVSTFDIMLEYLFQQSIIKK